MDRLKDKIILKTENLGKLDEDEVILLTCTDGTKIYITVDSTVLFIEYV
jgi:hypothetical protein